MIKLTIKNETNFNFKYKRLFKKIIQYTLEELKIIGDTEASLIVTNNNGIKKMSKEYRDKNDPTDILSFPANYKELKPVIGYNMLGDIYLSHEMVEKQAIEFNHSSKREWSYLFAHGLLHLLGFDHKTKKEETTMNSIAYKIMDKIKVGRDA